MNINSLLLLIVIGNIKALVIAEPAPLFDTLFMENEDSCTKPTFSTRIAETIIKFAKNFVIPNPDRDTKFYLYTRKNPKRSQRIYFDDKNSLEASNFDPEKPIKILIHGFQNSHRNCLCVLLRNAYLQKGNFNIIVVDWSIMASRILYPRAVYWLNDVAGVINKLTKLMNVEFNVSYSNIYLIGHSLGAHMAGIAGRQLQNEKYNTIFGLDPAGPIFHKQRKSDVLKSGDATYVETIHTDMGFLGLGYKGQLGDASIYPDWGRRQKRCRRGFFWFLDFSCNHGSAYVYFAQTITNPELFKAKCCKNLSNIWDRNCQCPDKDKCDFEYQIGGDPSTNKTGIFYVNVTENLLIT